jgi:cytochrome c oxidase subunit 2
MGRRSSLRLAALLGLVALVAAACGEDHPLSTFDTAGENAESINDLFIPVLVIAAIVLIAVFGAVGYFAVRFRATKTEDGEYDDELPSQTHGNFRLEIVWTILPALLLAVIAVFTLSLIFELNDVEAAPDAKIQRVDVVGQQWWWEYQIHLDDDGVPDIVTANELVIPIGESVPLSIMSRDVIHSFWIPRLNGKRDAVPGRATDWKIQAEKAGRFAGQCTEFCGLSHAFMRMWTVAVTPDEFDEWAANQMEGREPLTEGDDRYAGEQIFLQQCSGCHVVIGVTDTNGDGETDDWDIYDGANEITSALTSGAAPNLTHIATRTTFAGSLFDLYVNRAEDIPYLDVSTEGDLNRKDLTAWVSDAPERKPAAFVDSRGMPPFTNLSGEEINLLVDYLAGLD